MFRFPFLTPRELFIGSIILGLNYFTMGTYYDLRVTFHCKSISFCSVTLHNILCHIDSNNIGGPFKVYVYKEGVTEKVGLCTMGRGMKNINFHA